MSAAIDVNGVVKQVQIAAPKIERVRPEDLEGIANAEKVSRVLNAQTEAIADIYGRIGQPYIDFEVQMVAGTRYTLQHKFGGAVRAWLVNWVADTFGANWFPYLLEVTPQNDGGVAPTSDEDTLVVLASGQTSGKATIRVSPKGV